MKLKKMDDSAQLILITGFTIGVAVITSTIMLNNIIFASNMASESSTDAYRIDMSNAIEMTTQATQKAYIQASQSDPFDGAVFNQYMENYSNRASRTYAASGVSFSVDNSTFFDAYFTSSGLAGGEPDWVVIENINSTSTFQIDVPQISKLSGSESDAFNVQAINQTGDTIWTLKLYKDGADDDDIMIKVDSLAYEFEDITGEYIDVLNDNPVNFHFNSSTAGQTYDLKFINGNNMTGNATIYGKLGDDEDFTWSREEMTNVTLRMSSDDMNMNLSIPVSLP